MTCEFATCTRRHLGSSLYCRHHKCRNQDCLSSRESGKSHCADHRCYYLRCKSANLGTSWACAQHKCYLTSCNDIRSSGRKHCSRHKCPSSGCARARKSGAQACESHICYMEECLSPSQNISGSEAFLDHTCHIGDCTRMRLSLTGNFCRRHSCQWSKTPCPEAITGGSSYCEQHKCPSPNCKSPCRTAGMYCENCRCRWEDCPEGRTYPGLFCSEHTCNVYKCVESVHDGNDYCSAHTCQWILDWESGARCSNANGSNTQWCGNHKCHEAGCANPRENEGWYCTTHTCSNPDCHKRVDPEDGSQCQDHIAQELAVAPQHDVLPIRSRQQNRERQAYGVGYIDGLAHGVNLPAAQQAEIRGVVGQGLDFGSAEHTELRDGFRRMVNNVTEGRSQIGSGRGGQRVEYVTSDADNEYDDE